jgi:hypothetical protein
MPGTWVTDLTHFLDEDGDIAPISGPAWRLAEYFTSIVAMASHPNLILPPEFRVRCRRRPGRKPCSGMIGSDLDFETEEDIKWRCPVCRDNGYLHNWKGSLWGLSRMDEGRGPTVKTEKSL